MIATVSLASEVAGGAPLNMDSRPELIAEWMIGGPDVFRNAENRWATAVHQQWCRRYHQIGGRFRDLTDFSAFLREAGGIRNSRFRITFNDQAPEFEQAKGRSGATYGRRVKD